MSIHSRLAAFTMGTILSLMIIICTPQFACGSELTVFGKTYIRETQKPQVFTDTFAFSQPGTNFLLVVKNGKNGSYRVSAAIISVNGKQILGTSDFDNQVDLLTRSLTLKDTNEIQVELRSKPGDFITLNIIGVGMNTPPIASAGSDQTVAVGATVTLDGSGSTDADGDPLAFAWSFVSRPSGSDASLSSSTLVRPAFSVDKAGSYVLQLVVNDGKTNSSPDTVSVTTINSPPVAEAGPNQSVHAGATVTLNGSGSSDVDGDPLSYAWAMKAKPEESAAILSSINAVDPTFKTDLPGNYVVQLAVNDGHVNSATDEVTISAANSAPVASAGPDQSVRLEATVVLDGTKSNDADGDSLTSRWSLLSAPAGSAAKLSDGSSLSPSFVADKAGTYVAQLIVNDGLLDSAPDTVVISTLNSFPSAEAGPDQTVYVNETVTLNGSGSSDVDGDPLTFFWALTSKPAGSAAALSSASAVNPIFVADKPGTYIAQLIVNDGKVDSAPDSITVTTKNSAPVAEAGPGQSVFVGETVTLDGSGSTDVDGNNLTFAWSLTGRPDGSTAALSDVSAVKPTFKVDKPGRYVAQLTVNDGTVNSAPDTVTFTTTNSVPIADAGPDQTVVVTQTIVLDGSGSSDVDGDLLTFSWSLTAKPSGSTATLSNASLVKPTFVADKQGTYVSQLIVNDGKVSSAPDTVSITTQNSPPVANAGPDQTVHASTKVQLNGSGSSDVDGDPLSYFWAITSKPEGSIAALSDDKILSPTITSDLPGVYVIELIVNDGHVNSSPETVTITTLNSKPVAEAGKDQKVALGSMVQLSGSGSSDADQDPLTYSWSISAAPGGSKTALQNATSVDASFVPDLLGIYVIQLIVKDGVESSLPDTAAIEVIERPNTAPVAANDNYSTHEDTTLVVGAAIGVLADDSDPDGNAITATLLGNVTHGTLALSGNGSFTYVPNPNYNGTDSFTYTATDGQLASNVATVTITIQPVNDAPVANAGENQTVNGGATVQLSGAGSSDHDGNTLTYKWTLSSKPGGSAAALSNANILNPTFVADKAGIYEASLVVNDGTVDSAPDIVTIDAISVNQSPVAKNLSINMAGDVSVTIILRGSDPDGDPLTFIFPADTLHGKLTGTAPVLTYTPQAEYVGLDNFTYQVNDGKGGTATATVSINICVSSRGLAAYYPFNNNANDESGNGNNGTVFGSTAAADRTGRGYSAYSFDGVNDYIQVSSSNLAFPGGFTFSAWVRNLDIPFAGDTRNHIITLSAQNALALEPTYQYSFRISNSGVWPDYIVTSTNTFADENYHHVTGVYDYENSVIKIFVDGRLEGTTPASGAIRIYPGAGFYIGDYEQATRYYSWKGAIDDVRIYNRAISEYEIQQLAASCCATETSNQSPRITSMPLTVGGIGYRYSYQVLASDPEGDPLTFSIPAAPSGMTIDPTGLIQWTPDAASDARVSVQVADSFGGTDIQNFSISIGKGNSPVVNSVPIAHAGDDFTVDEGKQDQLDGSYSFDSDSDPLTYSWVQTSGPAVQLDSTKVQKPRFIAPAIDKNTILTFELTVNDGMVDSAPAKVNVMVLNTDIWPDGSGMVVNCNLDGAGSLKAAVDYANTHPGTRITFSIPDTEPCYGVNTPGVWTLKTPSRMKGAYSAGILLQGEGTLFDGNSQAENQGDRNPYGPEIELDESGISVTPFQIIASNVVVRGIVFNRNAGLTGTDAQMHISAGQNVVVYGNYFGTDATGTQPVFTGDMGGGDVNSGGGGIAVQHDALDYTKVSIVRNLRIGGSRPGEGNLFTLHPFQSIYTSYPWYTFPPHDIPGPITIQGNTFGLDRTGTRILDWAFGDVTPALWSNAITIESGKDILIGGVTAGSRNVMAGVSSHIRINGNSELGSITIQGNYLGTDTSGSAFLNPNCSNAIIIYPAGSPITTAREFLVGGSMPGAGNVIASCPRYGGPSIQITDGQSTNPPIRIQGNMIGTDVTGTKVLNPGSLGRGGISTTGGRLLIGGSGPGEGNVIGGFAASGIQISGIVAGQQFNQHFIEVKGNRIGLGADGVTPIPNGDGIWMGTTIPHIIGGPEPGEGNIIAFNQGNGVYLHEEDSDWYWRGWPGQILGNRIHDNGGRGIIRYYGTPNDPGDADSVSPLYRQNYPILNRVEVVNGATLVEGSLDTPNPERCLIEIFANRSADPSGFGEGEQWITALYPQTDGTFSATIPQDLTGKYLTATATLILGTGRPNTSEFSAAALAGAFPSTNLPPAISSSPKTRATTETAYGYQIIASDPEGQPLHYSLALAPEGMTVNPAGLISWTPTAQQTGNQVVTVVAYDPEGLYDSQNFTILTEPLLDVSPPVISPSLPLGLTVSAPYQVTGTICDSHIVEYAIEVAPSGTDDFILMASGNTCVENGVLGTIDPTRLANGTYVVRFTAWDESGNLTVFDSIDPIEVKGKLKIGQFSLAFQDISVPVSGIPINVTRTYNSFNKKQGDFGTGWEMALGTGVKVQVTRSLGTDWTAEKDYYWDPGGTGQGSWVYKLTTAKVPKVLVTYADGRQDRFEFRPKFVADPAIAIDWVNPIYKPLEGTTSKLEDLSGAPLYLQGNQLLDMMGEDVDVYNPGEFRLTTADGMVLIISKLTGLKSISDRNGNTVTFSPTGIAHSAGVSIGMLRDFKNRIIRITDPMGKSVSYFYNANDDLASVTDQAGNVTKYGYDADHNLTSIIDPRGIEVLKVQYDAEGRMIGTVDGLGKATEVTNDTANATEYVKDRNGFTTVYKYDNDGNITSVTDPLGHTTLYTFDANGNQLTKTDPLGNTWTWTYDANNNKLSDKDPLGNTRSWTYNSNNQMLTQTDALGRVTAYEYDAKGNLLKKTDPMGNLTTHTYDWRGNPASTTDCFGTTTYEYNAAGLKTKETDALGHVTTYTYDSNGNELTMIKTRTGDTGPVTMTTTKEYDGANRLVKQTDPDGSVATTEYNSLGKRSASIDKRGNRTTFEYDQAGNLTKTTYPDGKTEINTYDGNGNRVTHVDRAGATTGFRYDPVKVAEGEQNAQNRLTQTTFPDGGSTHIEYDSAGRIAGTVDENGNRTSFEYDAAGRRTKVINTLGQVTAFTYNASGNQASLRDANGNVTSYEYDALNRQAKVIFPDGTFTAAVYEGCGGNRKTSETDQAGNKTVFAYDALGHLKSVTDALGAVTSYTYDEAGNRLTQTDPNGHATSWSFDSMGRTTKRTLPLGMSEAFTYDLNGNVLTKTDFNGKTITYTYDVMNRLTKKVNPDASQVTYVYTAIGSRASVTDSGGTTAYTYGPRNRLTRQTNPDGSTLEYIYDLKGNRTSVKVASGTTSYTYDALNRLATVTDPDGNTTAYTYDSVGNRAAVAYPNATMAEYRYNTLNRLTYLENRKTSGEIISSYAYALGPNGNRIQVVENTGRMVDYTYDAVNRLTGEKITDSALGNQTISYTYDAFGNRLTRTDGTGTTTYTYNANDQLLTETAPGYTATYEYDGNGNTVKKTQGPTITAYSYDFENRLIASQTGTANIQYEYDADGIRTKAMADTGVTKYLVDKNRSYAEVLEEKDSGNALIASYVHGDGLISQKRGTNISYYQYDGHMSTRQLTSSSGLVTDIYSYDAFGNMTDRQGVTINNHLYTGEQYEPNVGFYYLRARYYNPANGRFVTTDPFPGSPYEPPSIHKYLYGHANPVNSTDPTGLFSMHELVTMMAIETIMMSMMSSAVVGGGYLYGVLHGGRMPLKWKGTIEMFSAGFGPGIVGVAVGGAIVRVTNECFCTAPNKGIEMDLVYLLGFIVGVQLAAELPENPLTGAMGIMGNLFDGDITLFTPGVFGAKPEIFLGPCTMITGSGALVVGKQAGWITMGMGSGDFSGSNLGLGLGVQWMGGISMPLSFLTQSRDCPCSR